MSDGFVSDCQTDCFLGRCRDSVREVNVKLDSLLKSCVCSFVGVLDTTLLSHEGGLIPLSIKRQKIERAVYEGNSK